MNIPSLISLFASNGRRLSAVDVEKRGVTQCNEMTILTDSFVPVHALLF